MFYILCIIHNCVTYVTRYIKYRVIPHIVMDIVNILDIIIIAVIIIPLSCCNFRIQHSAR